MIRLILIFNIFCLFACRQIIPQTRIDFHSPANIRLFADYLFCQKDYLRAYDEYKSFLDKVYNDTAAFKAALSLQKTEAFEEALNQFDRIPPQSGFYSDARIEYSRTLFLKKDFPALHNTFNKSDSSKDHYSFIKRLNTITYLYSYDPLPPESSFINPFPGDEKSSIKKFYEWKEDPPYKDPLLAAVLSAVIPGLGKVYTENYTDGIFAAFLTGVFGYLAYTNFNAEHYARGWIFTGVSGFFYTGSIYGSAASAQIYNAKIRFNFEADLRDFLNVFHYLSGDYNFCK